MSLSHYAEQLAEIKNYNEYDSDSSDTIFEGKV